MTVRNYGLVEDVETFQRDMQRLLDGGKPIGIDCETGFIGPDMEKFAVHPETAILVGISYTDSEDWARYVPVGHDAGTNLPGFEVARALWPVAASGRCVAHNAGFELRHLSRFFMAHLADDPEYGSAVRASNGYFPVLGDSMVLAYLAAEYEKVGLKALTKEMFGHEQAELHELFPGLAKNKRKFLRFNPLNQHDPAVVSYACEDAVWCLAIYRRYVDPHRHTLLGEVEHAIATEVCPAMEDYGVRYDWGFMRRGADELREFQDKFNAEIMNDLSAMLGKPVAVNLGSPAQVGKLLYEDLGLRTTVYTKTTRDLPTAERKMSTGKIALARLSKNYPVVRKIVDWKEMRRLLGTYLEKYEARYGYAADGHTHPSHLSAFVVTGRFAVADPPYQQSPKKYRFVLESAREVEVRHVEAHGKNCACDEKEYALPRGSFFEFNFRDAIVAPPGMYILGFDLSQAELRAVAGEAQEKALLDAFAAGEDVHQLTAALMLRIPLDEVTKDQRDVGKTLNFALLYGMSEKALADRLGIDIEEANALYRKYFAALPAIGAWKDKQVMFARQHGHVISRFGRKLPIWAYKSDKRWIRSGGDRQAVNFPIQGAATGDFVKIAMVRAHRAIQKAGLADKVKLVMNVHDALEWYVDQSLLPQEVMDILQPQVIFDVPGWPPMRADWHVAARWGSPREIERTPDGRLFVKDQGSSVELIDRPSYEEDDEGDLVPVLPDVDVEVAREMAQDQPVTQPVTQPVNERTQAGWVRVFVDLPDLPTAASWQAFLDLCRANPGPNTVTARFPDGQVDLDLTTGLDRTRLADIALVLGPVTVVHDASTVDMSHLVEGLNF